MIWIGIPTGNRGEAVIDCVKAWQTAGFKVAIITWDKVSEETLAGVADAVYFQPQRVSWGANHNKLASMLDFSVYVCCNDDTFPVDVDRINNINPAEDIVVFCNNPFSFCFPIVTRKYYDCRKSIFDEQYTHNFSDTDIFMQSSSEKTARHCPNIRLLHKHFIPDSYKNVASGNCATFNRDGILFRKKWPSFSEGYARNSIAKISLDVKLEVAESEAKRCNIFEIDDNGKMNEFNMNRFNNNRKVNKMKAIILANGQATRFNGQCKQVLLVNGEPVIMRTVRQLKENGINDILIVTVWDEIKALFDNFTDVGQTKGVVKTIEGCRDDWIDTNDTILFLLGDVVWTDEAIKIAIETNKNVAFFGSEVEIFGVRVTPAGKSEFINGIRLCNFYKEFTTWVLYRLMAGFRTQQHKFETEMFVKITDKTDDIDYPSKYESRIANGYYGDFGTAPVTEIIVADGNVDPFPIAETVQEVNENIPETVVDDKKVEEMPKIVKKRGRKPKISL